MCTKMYNHEIILLQMEEIEKAKKAFWINFLRVQSVMLIDALCLSEIMNRAIKRKCVNFYAIFPVRNFT